jgi:hypothetical protein
MNWEEALELLENHIHNDIDLDVDSTYKFVRGIPPEHNCTRYDFNGEVGYKIQVGQRDFIDVPLSMLKKIHNYCQNQNNGIYDRSVLIATGYERQLNGKPCYTHAIGKLFVTAQIAIHHEIFKRKYVML